MGFVENLYRPMSITGENIDARYFKDNGDGTYTPTPLFIYNVARDVHKFAKDKIFDLDESNQFHTAKVREVKDTWAQKMHDDQWKVKYGELTKEANKRWKAYRAAHPEEFETKFKRVAIGGEDEARFFAGYAPDIKLGLTDMVKLYNAATELQAKFAGPDKDGNVGPEYDTLPFEEPLYSKAEFAEAHKAVRAKISEELGIPNDDFEVGKVEKVSCRISNKKCAALGADDTHMEEFVDGLIKHLTSSNAVEFNKKRLECITFIDKDFNVTFNDTVTNLHSETGPNESIVIFTKREDDAEAIKFIIIGKDDPTDVSYKYRFVANSAEGTNLNFTQPISTKADLRKAIHTNIEIIEKIPSFAKYIPDLKAVEESL